MTLVLQLLSFLGDCALDLARNEYAKFELGAGKPRTGSRDGLTFHAGGPRVPP